MNNQITLINQLQERKRFYLNNGESAGEALAFIKQVKDCVLDWEEKIKSRASEIMDAEGEKVLNHGKFKITKIDPTESLEYKARNVFDALGSDALDMMKVSGSKLRSYITKNRIEGEKLGLISKDTKRVFKSGYLKIVEVAEKENPFIKK